MTDYFHYQNGQFYIEEAKLSDIAQTFDTPCYVYSRAAIEEQWRAFDDALGSREHLVCYAVKANSSLAVLNVLARLGSGFDIVSVGELERVLKAGGDARKVVFSGVGKRADEMRRALEVGIHCFNVESESELERLNAVAKEVGVKAPVSLRVNPDVDAGTHPYISTGLKENKFGIDIALAPDVYSRAACMSHIEIVGIDCHIGSQLTDTAPFIAALERVIELKDRLQRQGINLQHLDLGGGLGITYRGETPPLPGEYIQALLQHLDGWQGKILIEPGRAIVGNAGVLLTTVEYLKCTEAKNFAIIDAGMNDLLRPALYNAWQQIVPLQIRAEVPTQLYDVVGPVCETGDFLGKSRELAILPSDVLAVLSAGAYGFAMASNYNTRPLAAEVMVDKNQVQMIRKRQSIGDLLAGETVLAD